MSGDKLLDLLEKWGKYIGFLVAIAGLISIFADSQIVAYVLLAVAWMLIFLWLWGIYHEKPVTPILIPGSMLSRLQKKRRRTVGVMLVLINIAFGGLLIFEVSKLLLKTQTPSPDTIITPSPASSSFPDTISLPASTPSMTLSPFDFVVVLTEFSQGVNNVYKAPNSADIRDLIYRDLTKTIIRLELDKDVSIINLDGVLASELDARRVGEYYNADLVIWGYIPAEHPGAFRPTFTVLSDVDRWQESDAALFNIGVTGSGSEMMLTNRVTTVTSFVLAVSYLDRGGKVNFIKALSLLNQGIRDADNEYQLNPASKHDLVYNLALLYLVRGQANAALDREDEALDDFQKSLAYWPDFPKAYAAIGNVYYGRNDLATALENYKKAETKWYGMYGMGLVFYRNNRFQQAVSYFEASKLSAMQANISGVPLVKIDYALGLSYYGPW